MGSMETFLQKMNEDAETWNRTSSRPKPQRDIYVLKPETNKKPKQREPKKAEKLRGEPKSRGDKPQLASAAAQRQKCEENETYKKSLTCSVCSTDRKKNDCLGCFLSRFKENSVGRQPLISEALLGSFIASLYWLQKSPEVLKEPSVEKSSLEEKKKTRFELRESTVQMICDICEALGGASVELKEPKHLRADTEAAYRNRVKSIVEKKALAPFDGVSCLYSGQNSFPRAPIKKSESTESPKSVTEDINSELESDLEEPFSSIRPLSTHYDLIPKPSLTCMRNLMNSVGKETSVSVPPTTAKSRPSWIEKLSNEIVAKIKKRKSKTNVRIFQDPKGKPDLDLKRLLSCMEFKVTTDTPMGAFDLTVLQYKKSRLLKESIVKPTSNSLYRACDSSPGAECLVSDMKSNKQPSEHYFSWSDESFSHPESELISNSGESEELEEFVEIFFENHVKNKKNGRVSHPYQTGILRRVEFKHRGAHFFVIQKCFPVYRVEELLLKTPTRGLEEAWVIENIDKTLSQAAVVPLTPGGKQQNQVVIQGTSSELVIYIQVEVEGAQSKMDQAYLEYQRSSLGTQTPRGSENAFPAEEKPIKLKEQQQEGVSLFQVWKGCEGRHQLSVDEVLAVTGQRPELPAEEFEKTIDELEQVISVKEPKEKTVTFSDELPDIVTEREIQETFLEEKEKVGRRGTATVIRKLDAKQRVDIWLPQLSFLQAQRDEVRVGRVFAEEYSMTVDVCPVELQTALKLIREIETDIVEVKLSDAISILPRLETELRKHLQDKIKRLEEKQRDKKSSLHNFFSATDFLPGEESPENTSDTSEDRLNNLLAMLSNLESAVKSKEYSTRDLREYDSSKIYNLLQALTASIRELEGVPTLTSLSQTMEIASELDTAVREYDSIVRRQPLDYVSSGNSSWRHWKMTRRSLEEVTVMQHLKNVRRKVFEIVEEEAVGVEGRVEKDFDRLDILERENDEALMFLEAFLLKTQRRVNELSDLKIDLRELSVMLKTLYESLKDKIEREREKEIQIVEIKEPNQSTARNDSSIDSVCVLKQYERKEAVRETISGLLQALDTLKSKARMKNEVCKKILSPGGLEKKVELEGSSRRSSRSSFTTKNTENLFSTIKEFKKIGQTSLYMAWTKPEGFFKGSIVGYQIHVNDKLNQKVRNPQRLQAVLYSVDLNAKAVIQLYGVVDSGQKILLATVSHHSE